MRKHFFSFLLITGMLCSTGESFAQTVIINGEKNNRPLRWADFTGNPDNNTDLFAYTYWYVTYKWGPFSFKGDTVKWKVEVTLELEKRSWQKSEKVSDSLLVHEQGHFNIGLLFARTFQQRVNNTVFLRHNYEAKIAEIFNEELEKFRQLEIKYDQETDHFTNREQQKKWDDYFKKALSGKS
jgi:hypothetical protein